MTILRLLLRCWYTLALAGACVPMAAAFTLYDDSVEIVVTGNADDDLRQNIVNHLALAGAECQSPAWRVQRLFAEAGEQIQNAMQALGYYGGKAVPKLRKTKNCWEVTLAVTPGERVRIKGADIQLLGEAHNDPAFVRLLKRLPVKVDKPLNHGDYERTKQMLRNLAAQRGYFASRFSVHELRVNPRRRQALVHLHFDSGPRYRFGRVDIQQQELDAEFMKRMVPIREGEPYDAKKLTTINQNLSNSNYFSFIDIRPREQQAEDLQVPLDVRLTALKRHYYRLGAGFDTDTGPRLTAGYENRRINRDGHRFKADLKGSIVLSEASLEYRVPLEDPVKDYFAAQAGYRRERTDNISSDKFVAGGKHVQQIGQQWVQTLGLNWVYEKYHTGLQSGEAALLVPEAGWSRRRADNNLWIRKGYLLNFETRGSYAALLSDASFLQLRANARWIRQLPWRWAGRLLGHADIGVIWTDQFGRLPTSFRFYAGGDQSVRGYNYKEIGPADASGEAIGGRYLGAFGIEYEQPLTENWGIAAFIDSGSVTDEPRLDFKTGIGLGVRWHTLIGPVRADIAVPLNEAQSDFRLHFSMGPEF